jgi:hypothetical protein
LRAEGKLLARPTITNASVTAQLHHEGHACTFTFQIGTIKEVALKTEQARRLDLEIGRIWAGEAPGDVLLALLRVTAKHLRRLDSRTRGRVVLEFITTLVRVTERNSDLRPEMLKRLVHPATHVPRQLPVRERTQIVQYPPNWWRIPEYRSRRQLARSFIEDHPVGEFDQSRFAIMKGILCGLLTYSPVWRTISVTKQGNFR